MKTLKLNLELSRELMEFMDEVGDYVELSMCYNNTFKAITAINISSRYNIKDYKVAYGFVDKKIESSRLYFRHAFLVNTKEGYVVDVTACLWEEADNEWSDYNYYVFKEYENVNDYTDALIKEDGKLALEKEMKEYEVKAVNNLSKKGMEYNPIDLVNLINRVYGRDFMKVFRDYQETKEIVL